MQKIIILLVAIVGIIVLSVFLLLSHYRNEELIEREKQLRSIVTTSVNYEDNSPSFLTDNEVLRTGALLSLLEIYKGKKHTEFMLDNVQLKGIRASGIAFPAGAILTNLNGDLSGLGTFSLTEASIRNSSFRDSSLNCAALNRSIFLDVNFDESSVSGVRAKGAKFEKVSFKRVRGLKGDFSHAKFVSSDLSDSNFISSKFTLASFKGCNLDNSKLGDVEFNGAKLVDVSFSSSDLYGADFSGCFINNVSFRNADLTYVSFLGATLSGVDFSGANVKDVLLPKMDLNNSFLELSELQKQQVYAPDQDAWDYKRHIECHLSDLKDNGCKYSKEINLMSRVKK